MSMYEAHFYKRSIESPGPFCVFKNHASLDKVSIAAGAIKTYR